MTPGRRGLLWAWFAAVMFVLRIGATVQAASGAGEISVVPVFAVHSTQHGPSLSLEPASVVSPTGSPPARAVFRAATARIWPVGLVPVFAVEKPGRFELRRRPPTGQESFTEPLFFALPLPDETNAVSLAGKWDLEAIRGDKSKARTALEVALLGEKVSARFDPLTDYRFAHVLEASFVTNRLELQIRYVMDEFRMVGVMSDGILTGEWKRVDESEAGTFTATRSGVPRFVPPATPSVTLYEWTEPTAGSRAYLVDGESPGSGWKRGERGLCRVWRAP